MPLSELVRVILLVFAAVTCVVIGDTAGKLMTAGGVDPFFVAWSRFALAGLVLLPFSGLTRDEVPELFRWRILLRAAAIAAGVSCILTALRTEPLANVFGAFFIGPVVSCEPTVVIVGRQEVPGRMPAPPEALGPSAPQAFPTIFCASV